MSQSNLFTPSLASSTPQIPPPPILSPQWSATQKKTFTKWINSKLPTQNAINEIKEDLPNGVKLIQLLEIIGTTPEETVNMKHNKQPKMRIQMVENINTALRFIKSRNVNLTNIGAEDIVDGNEKLMLGMIWTIILRFTISDISEEGLTAKEGLLLWCQRKTAGYEGVSMKDFSSSWTDGLALCALIHRHRPDLLDFHKLDKSKHAENTALAFDVAEREIGITKLLDVEDLCDTVKPDERSVMTYVAQYFHAFAAAGRSENAGRRIAKFSTVLQSSWDMQNDYIARATKVLQSIKEITESWNSGSSTDQMDYPTLKSKANEFTEYKRTTKRELVQSKFDAETTFGNIRTKLKTYNLKPFECPEHLQPKQVDEAWASLLEQEAAHRKEITKKLREIKENLRVQFAEAANSIEKSINETVGSVAHLDGELEGQLETAKGFGNQIVGYEEQLEALEMIDGLCKQANIENNDHTVYSLEDVMYDLSLLKKTVQTKISFLENQITVKGMSNLTPQQIEEFEATFKHFDKDASNTLNRHEFKAAIGSLGIAQEGDAFEAVFTSVSHGSESIDFEQFTKYMVSITEDQTTPEQLEESFATLSGKEYVTEQDMQIGQVPAETIDYLKKTLPVIKDGYDYKKFLASAFATY